VTRILLAGVAGAIAWLLATLAVFGPAQRILTDPRLQSAKFLAAFADAAAPPRAADAPWIVPAGILLVSCGFALAYALVHPALGATRLRRGATFGFVAWLLMAPWFEFYLPWNVMLEPWPLVLLELLCWFLVLQVAGQAIAWSHDGRQRKDERILQAPWV
jgi:hypothetical protein